MSLPNNSPLTDTLAEKHSGAEFGIGELYNELLAHAKRMETLMRAYENGGRELIFIVSGKGRDGQFNKLCKSQEHFWWTEKEAEQFLNDMDPAMQCFNAVFELDLQILGIRKGLDGVTLPTAIDPLAPKPDQNRWNFDRSSGCDGWRCADCGTWVRVGELVISSCKCVKYCVDNPDLNPPKPLTALEQVLGSADDAQARDAAGGPEA